jgi:predicted transglutaminase-like cysteine proteinase
MSKRTKIALSLTVISILIISAFSVLYFQSLNGNLSNGGSQGGFIPFISSGPSLQVNLQQRNGVWRSDPYSDLPLLEQTVTIFVKNLGNGEANQVQVTIKDSGSAISQYSISSLQPSESNENSFVVNLRYDSSKEITANAYCDQSSDAQTISISAQLRREFDWSNQRDEEICKLFVTPQEQSVVNLRNQIINDKFILTPNWMALRDWVGNNIQYTYDSAAHGQDEYWQLPRETMSLRTGDCEDFSILLCSLLRADGWSSNNAYVVIGQQGDSYHAWVRIIWQGIEYNIEPQQNGWSTFLGDYLSLSGYSAEYKLNDLQFSNV